LIVGGVSWLIAPIFEGVPIAGDVYLNELINALGSLCFIICMLMSLRIIRNPALIKNIKD
jgi:hypothetical protein